MGVVTGIRVKAVVAVSSLSPQCYGREYQGLLAIVSCQSQSQGMQPPSWLKSSIIQQTRSSILSWLQSKRDSLRNLKQKKWKKEKHELFALSFLIGFLSIPSAIAIDFSHFELFLSWKCLHLMKQTSPLPDAWCLWTLFLASADQYQLCSLSVCLQSLKLGSNEFFFHLKLSGAVWWNQQHLHTRLYLWMLSGQISLISCCF